MLSHHCDCRRSLPLSSKTLSRWWTRQVSDRDISTKTGSIRKTVDKPARTYFSHVRFTRRTHECQATTSVQVLQKHHRCLDSKAKHRLGTDKNLIFSESRLRLAKITLALSTPRHQPYMTSHTAVSPSTVSRKTNQRSTSSRPKHNTIARKGKA